MAVLAVLLVIACTDNKAKQEECVADLGTVLADLPSPTEESDRVSYAYGYLVAYSAINYDNMELNTEYMARGINDAISGSGQFFDDSTISRILTDYNQKKVREQQAENERLAAVNLQEAESFLETNATRDGVNVTDSGLQYEVLEEGSGPTIGDNDTVSVLYNLILLDGREVDGTNLRGDEPAVFRPNQLIPGIREGLQLMKVGSKYRFWVHPQLGYGEAGAGNVGPNCLLIFEFEILSLDD